MRISDWSSDVCSSDLGPVDDTQAMAANVAALWRSGRAAAIGAAARSHVVARYSWTRTFERLLGEIYPAALRHAAMRAPDPRLEVRREIGRASCRERVCQYVEISVVAVDLKKKHHTIQKSNIQIIHKMNR